MQTIGERLEDARKRRGLSIREAAEATKIRGDYLTQFEENRFDINLPEIYVRGFIRNYASFLHLNPDKIATDYNGLGLAKSKSSRKDNREVFGRIEAPPEPAADDESDTPPAKPERPKSPFAGLPISLDRSNMVKIGIIGASAIVALVVLVFLVRLVISPGRDAPPTAVQADQTITLIALDNVRVKVARELDGEVLFQGTMVRGETRSLTKSGGLYITADVGRNLEIDYRGRRVGVGFDGYGRALLQ